MIGGAGKIQGQQENEQWNNSRRRAAANVKYWQWKAATRRNGQGGERGKEGRGKALEQMCWVLAVPRWYLSPFSAPVVSTGLSINLTVYLSILLSKLGACGVAWCSAGCQQKGDTQTWDPQKYWLPFLHNPHFFRSAPLPLVAAHSNFQYHLTHLQLHSIEEDLVVPGAGRTWSHGYIPTQRIPWLCGSLVCWAQCRMAESRNLLHIHGRWMRTHVSAASSAPSSTLQGCALCECHTWGECCLQHTHIHFGQKMCLPVLCQEWSLGFPLERPEEEDALALNFFWPEEGAPIILQVVFFPASVSYFLGCREMNYVSALGHCLN